MQKFELIGDNKYPYLAKVRIGDTELEYVKEVAFHIEAGELPQVEVVLNAIPNIICESNIVFSFSRQTIKESILVLRHELVTDGEIYDGFKKSILSAIRDSNKQYGNVEESELADYILKRVIGEEKDGSIQTNSR